MSEGLVTSAFLKALDELSHKLYIPATVLALCIDYISWIKEETGLENFWLLYAICFSFGGAISFWIIGIILIIDYWISRMWVTSGLDIRKVVGVFLLPLGVLGLFPEYFSFNESIILPATGVACSVWGFLFLSGRRLG